MYLVNQIARRPLGRLWCNLYPHMRTRMAHLLSWAFLLILVMNPKYRQKTNFEKYEKFPQFPQFIQTSSPLSGDFLGRFLVNFGSWYPIVSGRVWNFLAHCGKNILPDSNPDNVSVECDDLDANIHPEAYNSWSSRAPHGPWARAVPSSCLTSRQTPLKLFKFRASHTHQVADKKRIQSIFPWLYKQTARTECALPNQMLAEWGDVLATLLQSYRPTPTQRLRVWLPSRFAASWRLRWCSPKTDK